mmetsp:Transcript_1920/g.4836  ORF Transcript_1920/g.4836 Transcript_1920/m.4836 type:complete len:382 (+) Transcript_1920:282-1427(+)
MRCTRQYGWPARSLLALHGFSWLPHTAARELHRARWRGLAHSLDVALLVAILQEPLEEDLPRLVRGAHERPARDVLEAHRHALSLPLVVLRGRHHPHDGHVPLARAQVLAESEDLDAAVEHVAHHLPHLVRLLAQPEHDRALRHHVGVGALRRLENCHRLGVPRAAVAHCLLQPLDRLDVVRVHVEARARDERDAVEAAPPVEVGGEALDAHRRLARLHAAHHPRVVLGAAIGQVVAVDRGDHDVVDLPRGDLVGGILRLVLGRERGRAARLHVAEAASARARVAHDHDRRGGRAFLPAPTLADVRAARLLADGRELLGAERVLEALVLLAARHRHAQPLGLALHRFAHPPLVRAAGGKARQHEAGRGRLRSERLAQGRKS